MKRDVFQAIADPTRRAILLLVAAHAMTPNAIAEHFQCTRQGVSKHLQHLCECKLLTQQKTGREIYYQVNPKQMKDLDKWLAKFKSIWEQRFNQLDEILTQLHKK